MGSLLAKRGAVAALAACVCLSAGCGGSKSNFFDTPSAGSPIAGGGTSTGAAAGTSSAGTSGSPFTTAGQSASAGVGGSSAGGSGGAGGQGGAGGRDAAGGNGGIGGAGGTQNQGDAPCSPAKDVSGGMSGPLGTVGPVCLRVTEEITRGWGCSSFDGRTVKVNGRAIMCMEIPLPDKIDGAYYFDISAGAHDYASIYWY